MMNAIVLRGPEQVTFEQIEIPEPGPGDVLIKIESALTCGTDLKVFLRGGHPRMIQVPSVFGHEMAGIVEKIGDDVTEFKQGDRVVPANSAPCGDCYYCRDGMPNLCEDMLYINGAFAEYALIPERIVKKNLHRIPDNVDFKHAALTEPLACAMHGSNAMRLRKGETALVCGAGPLGLMIIATLKYQGMRVISADPVEERQEIARQMGADETVTPDKDGSLAKMAIELTDGKRGADASIDATGVPAVWEECVMATRKGGTVVWFGGSKPGTTVTLDTSKVHYDHLTIKGIYHHTPDYVSRAVEFIGKNAEKLSAIITTSMPLEDTEKALRMMAARKALKVEIR